MVEIKKRSLIFIIVISLISGACGMAVLSASGVFGTVVVSADEYEKSQEFEDRYSKLDYMVSFLTKNYYTEVSEEDLIESAYFGVVDGLEDIYSTYIPADEYQAYLESLFGTEVYYGVGITYLSQPFEKGFYATAVNTTGPAYAAGVRKGDYIATVNGVDALTMDGDTLRDTIRGELGTEVTIGLYRGDTYYEVTITRAEISEESVVYEYLDSGYAYIQITSFIQNTSKDFKTALAKAEADGAKGLIIDLRDNGGGLVSTALGVADQLMDAGTVVSTVDHNGNKESYTVSDGRTSFEYVVLVNGETASASEILSAGIQDNNEGTIIGTQTYGKGIIQNVGVLSDGSAIKYTELRYISPMGNEIHEVGITPDIIIDLDESCYDEHGILAKDIQLERAIEFLEEGK